MSVSYDNCAASVKQMALINATLKPYGTPYLLSNSNATACIYRYFCNNNCPHHINDCFQNVFYPNGHRIMHDNISESDKENIKSATQTICRYYGLFDTIDYSIDNTANDTLGGLIKHLWDDNRTFYSREYDRIVCTTEFRHLQYKTQIMVNSASDDQRTRMMHSIEVQKIAKKIAMGIHANWELAETIAIAHDIGHTPFGHEGEYIIKSFLQSKNSGTFSHALQGVKMLDKLTEHPVLSTYNIPGLGLSDYVLEGVLKHDSDTFTDGMQNKDFVQQYNVKKLCRLVGNYTEKEVEDYCERLCDYLKANGFKNKEIQLPQVLIGSIESQVVAWADKIAYLGHDWEEFIDTGLLEKMMSRINDMVLRIEKIAYKYNSSILLDDEAKFINIIWNSLREINKKYEVFNNSNTQYSYSIWDKVSEEIQKIICAINNIEKIGFGIKYDDTEKSSKLNSYHKYFTEKDYTSLKNYLILTASWVNLLGVYPRTYGLKNDPIYVFYQYLIKIRTNIITPKVSEHIISKTLEYVNTFDPYSKKSHDDYLFDCNRKWVYKYAYINKKIMDSSKARKYLKKTLRTCFLVGFHDEVDNDNTYIVGIGSENPPAGYIRPESGYDFDQKYNCLLYIFDFIGDEFIDSTRVKFMSHTAQEILNTLLEYYYEHPDMLPFTFRNRYNANQYELAIEDNIPEISDSVYIHHVDVHRARAAADYVAYLTDRMAKLKYDEIKSSDTKWSNTYSNT